jgi:hypothetical protein
MEPQERTVSPLHQCRRTTTSGPKEDHSQSPRSNGWAECREKNIGIGPMESTFLLTFLLIGRVYGKGKVLRFHDGQSVAETEQEMAIGK